MGATEADNLLAALRIGVIETHAARGNHPEPAAGLSLREYVLSRSDRSRAADGRDVVKLFGGNIEEEWAVGQYGGQAR